MNEREKAMNSSLAAAGGVKTGNAAGDADTTRSDIRVWRFLLIVGQLVLLILAIRQFQIESGAFLRVFMLLSAGFCVHYFLPLSYRIHWFLLLSLGFPRKESDP